ncbi:hypothetical protein N7468_001381 [Penicillium chermesinum]|uniref:Phosphotransferase n=1 Tax=Penicillium chermesinum TaxID=63820 RepID=A0A9W9TXA5_9EURO|nr:uncharacterized protein N7468_001381 [Penicillium chermesinum]KAJ5246398.1 hypothetical protein N7468_001381 [Penicillium chermesinum]
MASINSIPSEKGEDEERDVLQDEGIEDEDQEISTELSATQREQLEHQQQLDEFLQPLCLEEGLLYRLARRFSGTYRNLALTSDQQFLPTPVTQLPTGQETGRYLAIDVGGSNLRVAFIELLGDLDPETRSGDAGERSQETIRKAQHQRVKRTLERVWPIQEHLKMDKAEDLFAWIGDCIAEVVADSLSSDAAKRDAPAELDMGITFSFPIMQESLAEATLMPMGKGFAMDANLNLRSILLNGYDKHTRRPDDEAEPSSKRRKLFALPKLKIQAITNDTVATLASLAYTVKSLPNSRVAMGIIVGTGCNATIPMKLNALHESKAKSVHAMEPTAKETIVNTEWTISGAAPPLHELKITTKWDVELDKACSRPGFQPFEYMTGGRYIGELIRLILYEYLTTIGGLSRRLLPANLIQEYALSTSYISDHVARARSSEDLAKELNRSLPPPESSDWRWDARSAGVFQKIARTVQQRSAGLIAAAVVGLLACCREIELREDSNLNTPDNISSPKSNGDSPYPQPATDSLAAAASLQSSAVTNSFHGHVVPVLEPTPADWQSGPEELVVAYTGGIIQHYPQFKEMCQQHIDRLIMRTGPQRGGKSVFLREASDGGVIGAGVLAGIAVNK